MSESVPEAAFVVTLLVLLLAPLLLGSRGWRGRRCQRGRTSAEDILGLAAGRITAFELFDLRGKDRLRVVEVRSHQGGVE